MEIVNQSKKEFAISHKNIFYLLNLSKSLAFLLSHTTLDARLHSTIFSLRSRPLDREILHRHTSVFCSVTLYFERCISQPARHERKGYIQLL